MTQFIEFISGYSLGEELSNVLPQQVACVCCLSQQDPYINLSTCIHLSFLEGFFKFKMEMSNTLVCIQCHGMLKRIENFKRQVEKSIRILSDQVTEIKSDAPKLQRSVTEITEYVEPCLDNDAEETWFNDKLDVSFKQEADNTCEVTEIKVENDYSDIDINVPLAEMEKQTEDCNERVKKKKKRGHTCDICNSVLSSAPSFKEHSRRHLRRFECSACGKRYHDEYSAVQHYNELHGLNGVISVQFDCQECDFVTHSHRRYRYHRSKHRQDEQACTICGNRFASASNLKIHMYTVHKQSSRVFQCEPCGKVYKGKSGLFMHMSTAHGICDRRAYCGICHTYYRTQQNLAHHLRTHSNHITENDKRYVCDECDAKFITKANLKNHIEWEHLAIRKHRCLKCSKAFRRNTSLKKHIQFVHEKKRPPRDKICDYCGHGFTTQTILNSHIRTHTGERPHRCTHCAATFAHSSALYNHNKLLHNPHRIK